MARKQKKSTKRGFDTKREAEEWLRNFLQSQQADFNMKFEEFIKLYYEDMKPRIRENTMNTKKVYYRLENTNASRDKYIYQNVKVSGSEADTYVLSGYAKADSVPFSKSDDTNFFEINVKINYSDGSYVYKRPTFFNYAVSDWQHSTGVFTLSDNNEDTNKTPVSISVFCRYSKQINTCYFDDISLIKEPVPTYKYDSDGNLISATENAQKNANLSYDSNDNLTSFKDEKNAQYTYTYDEDH